MQLLKIVTEYVPWVSHHKQLEMHCGFFYQLYTMAHSILHTQCCRHGAEQQHFIRENRKALQPLRRHALLHTANLQRFGLLTK